MNEYEVEAKLEELTRLSRRYDSILVVDAITWKEREHVGQLYLSLSDWLWDHGVMPRWDQEQKKFVGKRLELPN